MLEERCIVSLHKGGNLATNTPVKDVGILLCNIQSSISTVSTFKKSSVKPNCAAISSTHIFAAQADKAVVHVYNLEKATQEAIVPFPERISSLTLIGKWNEPAVLGLGMETGRITLWELCTGRQVSTSPSHLEAVRCLTTDPTSNFLLSGSDDSNVHVWSVPALLSFTSTASNRHGLEATFVPERIFSNHRSAITGLSVSSGHMTSSFAISIAKDSTCMIWNFRTGNSLRTFLLPSPALSLVADPADRAIYAGLCDGSIQKLNLLTGSSYVEKVISPNEGVEAPIQPLSADRWSSSTVSGQSALTVALGHDGTRLLSGHSDGKLHSWDVGKGRYERCLPGQPGAISNIVTLPPSGLLLQSTARTQAVVVERPTVDRFQSRTASDQQESLIPLGYSFKTQFASELPAPRFVNLKDKDSLSADFETELEQNLFSNCILERGSETFSPLSGDMERISRASLQVAEVAEEVQELREQLKASRKLYEFAKGHMERLDGEVRSLLQRSRDKELAKVRRRGMQAMQAENMRKKVMGIDVEHLVGGKEGEEEKDQDIELDSTTTDAMSGSE